MKTINKPLAMTGDRPTGPLHLGHLVGSLENRVKMQEDFHLTVLVADTQALTDHAFSKEEFRRNITEVMKNYLAVGLCPKKVTFALQSSLHALGQGALLLSPLVSTSEMQRNPTVRQEIKDKNFSGVPLGFFSYPLFQAADILLLGSGVVPVGLDQAPMIEITNKVIGRLNARAKKQVFAECEALYSQTPKLVGLDGKSKMSKSRGTAISIVAPKDVLEKSVMMMYTDPLHLKKSDPGRVEGNVVFSYLDAFCEDRERVFELKNHYKKGGLGDVTIKRYLIDVLSSRLEPYRAKYNEISDDLALDVLRAGTETTRQKSAAELEKLEDVLGVFRAG